MTTNGSTDVIVGWERDGSPVHRRVNRRPPFRIVRAKLLAALAVGAAVDGDTDTKRMIAAEMGLTTPAAEFVWACLDACLRVDPFLRADLSAQRLDTLVRQLAGTVLDAADDVVNTVESLLEQEEL